MDWKYLFTSFEGRIGRQQWWMGIIVFFVLGLISTALDMILGTRTESGMGIIGLIVNLLCIYPSIALSAKRWHDRGKSGWWILINLIPFIGWIWALVENGFLKGTDGPNQYGPDPVPA